MANALNTPVNMSVKVADMAVKISGAIMLARAMQEAITDVMNEHRLGYTHTRLIDGLIVALDILDQQASQLDRIAYPKLEAVS